jgi:hypothetical protein
LPTQNAKLKTGITMQTFQAIFPVQAGQMKPEAAKKRAVNGSLVEVSQELWQKVKF